MTMAAHKIPEEKPDLNSLLAEHGMTREEYDVLLRVLGREPSLAEFGIAAAPLHVAV